MDLKKHAELCSKLQTYNKRLEILKKEGLVNSEVWDMVMTGKRTCLMCIEKEERKMSLNLKGKK